MLPLSLYIYIYVYVGSQKLRSEPTYRRLARMNSYGVSAKHSELELELELYVSVSVSVSVTE
jgi:hypothetical protein